MPAQTPLRSTLHGAGRRLTGQRQLLLELLQEHGGHLDALELYRLAQARDPRLNLSTVYRTLGLLRDLGLVDEQHLGEDHHHYELRTPSTHYHLICSNCGAVVEFTSPLIDELKAVVGAEHDYAVEDAQVDLLGVCAACRTAVAEQPDLLPDDKRRASPRAHVMNMLRRTLHPADGDLQAAPAVLGAHGEHLQSLRELSTGSAGVIAALKGGHGLAARLAALGLTPGTTFEMAQNPGHGPLIILVRDTRLVLGRGEAAHVLVAPAGAGNGR